MNSLLYSILESLLFVTALSVDALVASLAYGCNRIKIPALSVQIIALMCTGILGVSLLFGHFLKFYLPEDALKIVSFLILMLLGITKLLDNIIKALINKYTDFNKEIKFSLLNLNFILNIYADPREADVDKSKILSPKEAFSLAIALSIDNMAAGVGAAIGNINIPVTILISFLLSMLAIKSGERIGNKLSDRLPFNLSWLSGILLITMAFLRFL